MSLICHKMQNISIIQYENKRLKLTIFFTLSFPGSESLTMIFSSILNQHFGNVEYRIPQIVTKLADCVIEATMWLHNKVNSVFLPTATKFHYIFNLRDLSNIFQVEMKI